MAQPDRLTILDEIAETQRCMAEQLRSMHHTISASDTIISQSRELMALVEKHLAETARPPMTAAEAREYVTECMELAAIARQTSHQIMLQHMAET
jgi:trimethylamine:corrinoid methyltransferase-like protein